MIKYLSLIVTLCTSLNVAAQSDYAVAKIPVALTTNAAAVIRNEEHFFDYKSISSGRYDYKIAVTILNKAGEDFAEMAEVYDKFSSISNIKASLYDESGKKIKDYKQTDILDRSLISDYSLFEDSRLKLLKFYNLSYPYTIEYSFSQDLKGVLAIPSWSDIKGYNIATEKSTYKLQKASNLNVRLRKIGNVKIDSVNVGAKVLYSWNSANVSAVEREHLSAGFDNLISKVQISPSNFEYDGSSGNFDNWKNFGSWIHKLNENGNVLPPIFKAKVQALVKDSKDDKEKVSILYNYLQQNTRYVSVQLGIGGFRPISAEKVSQVSYGDCKALSNFMKAMLNEVGISSNLIVIGNGMPSLNEEFASIGQANHMIVCVPMKSDTTFLECTSQYTPLGFIGNDNSDRKVLMVTAEGGKVIRTPKYSSNDNYQMRKINVGFDESGKANIDIKTQYANAQFEDNMGLLLMDATAQRKALVESVDIKGAELIKFKYQQPNKILPIIDEELNFTTNQLFTKGGEKAFLTLNLVNRREAVPEKLENRKTNFAVTFSYKDTDEISYNLPKEYAIEYIPKNILLTSDFGKYEAKFEVKNNEIIYTRTQEMNEKTFPASRYNEFVDFLKKIYQADKIKAVLTKKAS